MSRVARKRLLPQGGAGGRRNFSRPSGRKERPLSPSCAPVLENYGKLKNGENPRGYPMATQVKALGHKGLRAPMPSKNRPLATGMATQRDLLLRLSADMPYVSLSMLQNLRGDNTLLRFHFSGVKTDENGTFGEFVELYRKFEKGGNPP